MEGAYRMISLISHTLFHTCSYSTDLVLTLLIFLTELVLTYCYSLLSSFLLYCYFLLKAFLLYGYFLIVGQFTNTQAQNGGQVRGARPQGHAWGAGRVLGGQ
jgi:hypothetical protein